MEAVARNAVSCPAVAAVAANTGSFSARSTVSVSKTALFGGARSNALVAKIPTAGRSGSRAVVCMAKASAAAGYAAALVELGQSTSSLEAIHKDIETLSGLVTNQELATFLASPVASDEQKKSVIKSIAAESGFNSYTTNFLNVLVDKKRMNIVKEIAAVFEELYCDVTDTQVAIVTSAVKLENSQQALIAKKLQSMTGAKNIKLKNVVDASLIAGFIVKYGKDGSQLIDMSVKGQLDRLAQQFELNENALTSA
jgi:F-type H+-transporting ATPase subunit delta